MQHDRPTFQINQGMEVVSVDGQTLGRIDEFDNEVMVVRKGSFFPQDHFIPFSAVAQVDDDRVHLNVTKEVALTQGWDAPANAGSTAASGAGTTGSGMQVDPQPFTHRQDTQATHINADDRLVVPVHEEELSATTHEVEHGVRIHRTVVEEPREVEMPVTEEVVHVSHRPVDREVRPEDAAFEGGTFSMPVRGEDIELQKQTRVREEIEIRKHPETRTEHVAGTIRHEEVTVEGADIADAPDTPDAPDEREQL